MRYFIIVFSILMCVVFRASADDGTTASISLQHQTHDNHSEYYPPADMPEVYLNSDEMEILVVADGFASYYNVDIVFVPTNTLVISTQISGYGDSIDISSLGPCYYMITIISEFNNVYQGYFTIE